MQNYANQPQSSGSGKTCLFLSLGCLGVCILACGGLATVGYLGYSEITSGFPIDQTFEKVQQHPQAMIALGEPIKKEIGFDIDMDYDNGDQTCEVVLRVYGPNGKGKVTAECQKNGEVWEYDRLVLKPDGGEEIDLLKDLVEVAEEEFGIQLDEAQPASPDSE